MKYNLFDIIINANDSVFIKIENEKKGYVFETEQEADLFFEPFYNQVVSWDGSLELFIELCYMELTDICKNRPHILLIKPKPKVEDGRKFHEINVKGEFAKSFRESQTNKRTTDIGYGYGKISFYGTEKELDEYIGYLVKNEGTFGFKII